MEEKREPIKVKLTTVIIIFLILIVVIVGALWYCNIKISKENEARDIEKESLVEPDKKEETNTTNESKENNITLETKDLDVNSELVQGLYQYVLKYSDYEEKTVYQSQKVTKDTMENKLKLMTVFENLSELEADEVKTANEYGIEVKHILFKKETVEKKAKEIFGKDVTITHEESPIYFTKAIDYKDGTYDCYDYQGGGRTPWEASISQIKNAEQKDDEIYIYDEYIHIYEDVESGTPEEGIYTASDRKTKISELINVSSLANSDKVEEIFGQYKEKLGSKIQTFKHTFKKNSEGTYYWYSTEPVLQQ